MDGMHVLLDESPLFSELILTILSPVLLPMRFSNKLFAVLLEKCKNKNSCMMKDKGQVC